MKIFTVVAAALAALQSVSAEPTAPPTNVTCATPTATATKIVRTHCRRIACVKPGRTCNPGEAAQPTQKPPLVFKTDAPEPGTCTATVEALDNPGCNRCPTCLPTAPAAEATKPAEAPAPAVTLL